MKQGFFFTLGKKGYFVETVRKNKTEKMLNSILYELYKIGIYKAKEGSAVDRKYISYIMQAATLEKKHCKPIDADLKEYDYYSIAGENFGGAYSIEDIELLEIA